jgi:hypothetical protein
VIEDTFLMIFGFFLVFFGSAFRFYIEWKIKMLGGFTQLSEKNKYVYRQFRHGGSVSILLGILSILLSF